MLNSISRVRWNFRTGPILCTTLHRKLTGSRSSVCLFQDTIEKDKDTNNEHWLYSQVSDTSRLLALSSGAT